MSGMTGMVVAVSSILFCGQEDASDLGKLEGTWKVVQMVEGGKDLPKDKIKNIVFYVKENRLILRDGRELIEKGTFELNSKANPKEWTTISESDESKPIKCIYKITAKQVILCIGEPGGERPKEFASREKSGVILLVLEKPDPKDPKPGN